jgi:hypothetical protein
MKADLMLLAIGCALVNAVDPVGLGAVITAGQGGVSQLIVERASASAADFNRLSEWSCTDPT